MSVIEKILSGTFIEAEDMKIMKNRLISDLKIDDKDKKALEQLEYCIMDIMFIILDTIHQTKVPVGLSTTWFKMTKDYWYLNKYNLVYEKNAKKEDGESDVKVKSIQVGDTTTTFMNSSTQIEIDGVNYETGKIDFSEDVLIEKYKKDLYRHRKMRW